jgi:hypothetical protein
VLSVDWVDSVDCVLSVVDGVDSVVLVSDVDGVVSGWFCFLLQSAVARSRR